MNASPDIDVKIERTGYEPPPEAAPAEQNMSLADLVQKCVEQRQREVGDEVALDELIRVDLGCGATPVEGFCGVDDNFPASDRNYKFDLFSAMWPIKTSDVDIYHSSHFVEHVPDWNAFFAEAWRTLKPGGYMIITTPYGNSNRAWQDPTHKQIITEERYSYLSKEWRAMNSSAWQLGDVDFDILGTYPVWHPRFAARVQADKTGALASYLREHVLNAILDLTAIIRAKK